MLELFKLYFNSFDKIKKNFRVLSKKEKFFFFTILLDSIIVLKIAKNLNILVICC